jgi:hypothetical protein
MIWSCQPWLSIFCYKRDDYTWMVRDGWCYFKEYELKGCWCVFVLQFTLLALLLTLSIGTPNLFASIVKAQTSYLNEKADGAQTTLSAVAFTKHGERLVGLPAKRQAVVNTAKTYLCSSIALVENSRTKGSQRMQHIGKLVTSTVLWHLMAFVGRSLPSKRLMGGQMWSLTMMTRHNNSWALNILQFLIYWCDLQFLSMVLAKIRDTAEQYLHKKVK